MTPPSVTLNCRLLCACAGAYDIDPATGRYQPLDGDVYRPVVVYLAHRRRSAAATTQSMRA